MGKDPEVLTVDEAAVMLGVHPRSIYSSLKNGRLPGRKVGRSWRLYRAAIFDWLSTIEDPVVVLSDLDETTVSTTIDDD